MSYLEDRNKRKLGLLPPLPTKKERKPIKKMSAKKAAEVTAEKEARGGEDTELTKWYKRQMKFMDVCEATGLRLETKIYKYAIMSICHILPKSKCKSVATHPLNRVFLLPDLHTKFDAMSWKEREQMSCWPDIRDRLVMLYPDLSTEERRHFPESVIDYMNKHNPF